MVRKLKRHKLIAALFSLALLLNFVPERTAGALRSSVLPILSFFGKAGSLVPGQNPDDPDGDRPVKITDLRKRIRELEAVGAAQREEIRRLRKALSHRRELEGVFGPGKLKLLEARVVVRKDLSNFRRTVVLNRGWKHGVEKGMPVIRGPFLVGEVSSVGYSACQAQLATDPAFRVRASVGGTDREGIVMGTGGEDASLKLVYCRTDRPPPKGASVLTSGYGGDFPADLTVGKIIEVEASPEGEFYRIRIEPAVNWTALDVVEIVVGAPVEAEVKEASR